MQSISYSCVLELWAYLSIWSIIFFSINILLLSSAQTNSKNIHINGLTHYGLEIICNLFIRKGHIIEDYIYMCTPYHALNFMQSEETGGKSVWFFLLCIDQNTLIEQSYSNKTVTTCNLIVTTVLLAQFDFITLPPLPLLPVTPTFTSVNTVVKTKVSSYWW